MLDIIIGDHGGGGNIPDGKNTINKAERQKSSGPVL